MSQQILPPISRLCECIDGTSQAIIADKLGLDATRFNQRTGSGADIDDGDLVSYTPECLKTDGERFSQVAKLSITCHSCGVASEFKGVFLPINNNQIISGFQCPNEDCKRPNRWGYDSHFDLLNILSNKVTKQIREEIKSHGRFEHKCLKESCKLCTRQLSVSGN